MNARGGESLRNFKLVVAAKVSVDWTGRVLEADLSLELLPELSREGTVSVATQPRCRA